MTDLIVCIVLYLIAFLCLSYGVLKISAKEMTLSKLQQDKNYVLTQGTVIALCVILGAVFIFDAVYAHHVQGHGTDMNNFAAWMYRLQSEGIVNFYSPDYYADYPPGYMYVLKVIGGFVTMFNLSDNATWLVMKLPAIICDILIALFVFKISYKTLGSKIALIVTALVAINPLNYINSAIWGQIDSVLTLFLLISLYNVHNKKYYSGVVWFILALLLKPQALMLGPVYLFAYLETKDAKLIINSVLLGALLLIAICIPFSPVWREGGNFFLNLIKSFNPAWIIDKYASSFGIYKYATVNAFNIYALFGANWKPIDDKFLFFSYEVWGWIITIAAMVASGFVYFKLKDRWAKIFGTAFFMIAVVYAFDTNMHERYIYPAIFFLLMLYISTKDIRSLLLFGGLSAANAANVAYVLYCNLHGNMATKDSVVIPIAFVQTLLIILALVWLYKTRGESAPVRAASPPSDSAQKSDKYTNPVLLRVFNGENRDIWKNVKLVRIDYIIISIIVVLYSCVAFINLGDTKAPQTFYKPSQNGDSFIVEFESPAEVGKISYYYGVGQVGDKPKVSYSFSLDGDTWTDADESCELKSVFKWDSVELESPTFAKFALGTFIGTEIRLGEVGFFDANGNQIPVKQIIGRYGGDYSSVADEQDCVPEKSSYRNGTYFDEIYHPRTAYEHLHLMPYYETTHPPLGKLIMSIGIALFGMTPFGWRFMGTLFGVLMLPLFYLFLKKIFGKTRYATLGTLLFALDFMHFSLTRMGTIDSYPVFFIILMYFFMYKFMIRALSLSREHKGDLFEDRKRLMSILLPLGLSGIAFGLGAASKWIAIYAGFGLFAIFVITTVKMFANLSEDYRKRILTKNLIIIVLWCALFFILIPLCIYIAAYIPISLVKTSSGASQYGSPLKAMLDNQKYMFNYHTGGGKDHPYASRWYQWPTIYRPLWAYKAPDTAKGIIGCISIMGNPLIWWAAIAGFAYSLYKGVRQKSYTILFLVISLASQYVPWMFIARSTFIYHFFASVPFMIMFLVYAIRELEIKFPKFKYATAVFLALCAILFVMFYPVLSGVEIPQSYADNFLRWSDQWVFYN